MLIAIWNMGTTGTLYDDPGADFFTRLHPEQAKTRALEQLRSLGHQLTLGRTGRQRSPPQRKSPRQRLNDA